MLTKGVEFSLAQQLDWNSKLLITTIQIDSYFVSFAFAYHKLAIRSHCCKGNSFSLFYKSESFQIVLSPTFASNFKKISFH